MKAKCIRSKGTHIKLHDTINYEKSFDNVYSVKGPVCDYILDLDEEDFNKYFKPIAKGESYV